MSQQQNIFVVDDEPAARDMIGDYLKDAGFRRDALRRWGIAARRAEKAKPDLVVLDLNMPRRTGCR
jgi:DNA-binding response OmpR family regulator